MYILNMFFIQRVFFLELWNDSKLVSKSRMEDASKDLLIEIDKILQQNEISMKHIHRVHSLSGPGSFSSIRIAYSTIIALQKVFNHIQYASFYLNDLIKNPNNLLIQLNKNIFILFQDEWKVIFKKQLDQNVTYQTIAENIEQNITKNTNQNIGREGQHISESSDKAISSNQTILNSSYNANINNNDNKYHIIHNIGERMVNQGEQIYGKNYNNQINSQNSDITNKINAPSDAIKKPLYVHMPVIMQEK
ncbi:hypothetical protein [Candidatus Cytomitobacter primus]|uniref:Gcp-like domain-containing protein n=1 Tax=Candidatus Cytomitobacter primus TaxID=2066024 RepID=A0A5C0UEG7_9PROT|nr:hypothetical protein [Candidatus Cytomitobacter primus]QEK38485.1 hypothetical protein FZC34_00960 [Candidatus Cytomitobacter primus]